MATSVHKNNICSNIKQLWEIAFKEIKQLWEIAFKEIKAFIVITLFVLFITWFSMIKFDENNHTEFKVQTALEQLAGNILTWNTIYALLVTGLLCIPIKMLYLNSQKREEQYFWFISQTFLDRVGAVFLGAAGSTTALFLFSNFFYTALDSGEFQKKINRYDIIMLYIAFTWFFLGITIIFKYWSKKLTNMREKNEVRKVIFSLYILYGTIILIVLFASPMIFFRLFYFR